MHLSFSLSLRRAVGPSFLTDKKEAKIWLKGAATFLQSTLRRLRIGKGRRNSGRGKCAVWSEDAPLNNSQPNPSGDALSGFSAEEGQLVSFPLLLQRAFFYRPDFPSGPGIVKGAGPRPSTSFPATAVPSPFAMAMDGVPSIGAEPLAPLTEFLHPFFSQKRMGLSRPERQTKGKRNQKVKETRAKEKGPSRPERQIER